MSRTVFEIAQDLASGETFKAFDGREMVAYKPHPEMEMVPLSMAGLNAAQGRLQSFLGIILPKEAVCQMMGAYLIADQDDREDHEA